MTITMRLINQVEENVKSGRAEIITKADVKSLIFEGGKVLGVEFLKADKMSKVYGPVILCTGG